MANLKMKLEHIDAIRDAIYTVLSATPEIKTLPDVVENYRAQNPNGDYAMRARWAMFHAADTPRLNFPLTRGLGLYDYINDSHIDSALKRIFAEGSST
jgi:hypothetical protein